jgi:hypothetical protein
LPTAIIPSAFAASGGSGGPGGGNGGGTERC